MGRDFKPFFDVPYGMGHTRVDKYFWYENPKQEK